MAEQTERLTLTPQEAAPMVPMGINQMYAAIREGKIPSLRVGRRILIPRKKFIAMLNGEESVPQDAAYPKLAL